MTISVQEAPPVRPPPSTITIVLTLDEAVQLQRAITSVNMSDIKDRLFDALKHTFQEFNIKGGLYV